MSNPFSQSAAVSVPFSGNADSSGNFSFSTAIRKAFWSTVKVVAEAPGNGHWSVKTLGGLPLDYAGGRACSMGPFIVPAGDGVTISLIGALPNAAVIGNIWGKQHPDMASAAEALTQSSNPLSVEIASLTGQGFLIELNTAGSSSLVFFIPPLLQNIVCVGRSVAAASTVTVTGQASGNFQTQPLTTAGQVLIFPASIFSQTDFNSLGANVAIFGNCVVDVFLQLGSMVSPVNTDRTPIFVAPSVSAALDSRRSPASFVPIDVAGGLGIGGTVALVGALAGQTVRLFGYHLETDAASGVGIASLEDNTAAVIDKAPLTAVPLGLFVDFEGVPLTAGRGVQLANRGSVATAALRGSLTYTQS